MTSATREPGRIAVVDDDLAILDELLAKIRNLPRIAAADRAGSGEPVRAEDDKIGPSLPGKVLSR